MPHRPENESARSFEQQNNGAETLFSRPFGSARPEPTGAQAPRRAEKRLFASEIGVDDLGKLLDRDGAGDLRPIDEKGRGSPDLERLDDELAARSDQTGRDSPVSERRRVA